MSKQIEILESEVLKINGKKYHDVFGFDIYSNVYEEIKVKTLLNDTILRHVKTNCIVQGSIINRKEKLKENIDMDYMIALYVHDFEKRICNLYKTKNMEIISS